jgi:hypothetical protein
MAVIGTKQMTLRRVFLSLAKDRRIEFFLANLRTTVTEIGASNQSSEFKTFKSRPMGIWSSLVSSQSGQYLIFNSFNFIYFTQWVAWGS